MVASILNLSFCLNFVLTQAGDERSHPHNAVGHSGVPLSVIAPTGDRLCAFNTTVMSTGPSVKAFLREWPSSAHSLGEADLDTNRRHK